jgi:hypothetical protein
MPQIACIVQPPHLHGVCYCHSESLLLLTSLSVQSSFGICEVSVLLCAVCGISHCKCSELRIASVRNFVQVCKCASCASVRNFALQVCGTLRCCPLLLLRRVIIVRCSCAWLLCGTWPSLKSCVTCSLHLGQQGGAAAAALRRLQASMG